MCLIFLSWQQDPRRPLIVAANRDEFFSRPTLAMHNWQDLSTILGGRDQEFGGSWMAISKSGRFAAVTNLRETPSNGDRSRGQLVQDFLLSPLNGAQFLTQLEQEKNHYRPFNLVIRDQQQLLYSNNIEPGWHPLSTGQHVLGNIPLSQRNQKTLLAEKDFASLNLSQCSEHELFNILADKTVSEPGEEPLKQLLSSRFISSPEYGTRSSSVLLQYDDGSQKLWERNFDQKLSPPTEAYFFVSAEGDINSASRTVPAC